MTDYHTKYRRGEGESSQWEDIQRKLGNFAPAEPVFKPAPFAPAQDTVKNKAWLDELSPGDLLDAEDEFSDDRFLEEYRYKLVSKTHPSFLDGFNPVLTCQIAGKGAFRS